VTIAKSAPLAEDVKKDVNIEKSMPSKKPEEKIPNSNKSNEIPTILPINNIISSSNHETKASQIPNMKKQEFIEKMIKLGTIAQDCQELVENETDLTKKEESRLYLKRIEFKNVFKEIRSSNVDVF
jgi:hypothetical protein